MAYDPDLQSVQNQGVGIVNGQVYGGYTPGTSAYSQANSGKAGLGSLVMAIFSLLNLFFLIVAACYSVGVFETAEATTDGASFFVVAIMTLLSGGLGLLTSYIGLRMSRQANSPLFMLLHKVLFILIIISAILIFIGPIFR